MGAITPMVGGAIPSLSTSGVTANGLNFDKITDGQSALGGSGLGLNLGTGQLALSGLGALGSLWGGMQAQGLAKKQYELTKNISTTNLVNQMKSYNTQLEDRARSRGVAEGNPASANDYLERNRMTRVA
jgi:hypothetical protein